MRGHFGRRQDAAAGGTVRYAGETGRRRRHRPRRGGVIVRGLRLARYIAPLSGAPRPMKMGTIASPWRYDGLSKFAQSLAEMSVGSQKRHVAAHGAGWPHPRSRGFTGGGEYRRLIVQLFRRATEPRPRPLD